MRLDKAAAVIRGSKIFLGSFFIVLVMTIATSCSEEGQKSEAQPNIVAATNELSVRPSDPISNLAVSADAVDGTNEPDIFIAAFRNDRQPVLDMLSEGTLTIENGCVVIRLKRHPEHGSFTAVFPRVFSVNKNNGEPVSVSFARHVFRFDAAQRIPGGPIGKDNGSYLLVPRPQLCPDQLFGLGG